MHSNSTKLNIISSVIISLVPLALQAGDNSLDINSKRITESDYHHFNQMLKAPAESKAYQAAETTVVNELNHKQSYLQPLMKSHYEMASILSQTKVANAGVVKMCVSLNPIYVRPTNSQPERQFFNHVLSRCEELITRSYPTQEQDGMKLTTLVKDQDSIQQLTFRDKVIGYQKKERVKPHWVIYEASKIDGAVYGFLTQQLGAQFVQFIGSSGPEKVTLMYEDGHQTTQPFSYDMEVRYAHY